MVLHGGLVLCTLESSLGSRDSVPSRIIMLCSWAFYSTVKVPFFTLEY